MVPSAKKAGAFSEMWVQQGFKEYRLKIELIPSAMVAQDNDNDANNKKLFVQLNWHLFPWFRIYHSTVEHAAFSEVWVQRGYKECWLKNKLMPSAMAAQDKSDWYL